MPDILAPTKVLGGSLVRGERDQVTFTGDFRIQTCAEVERVVYLSLKRLI